MCVEPGHTQEVVQQAGDVTFLLAEAGGLAGELLKPEVLLQQRKKEDGEDSVLELKLFIPPLLVSDEVEQSSVFPLLLIQILSDLPIIVDNVIFRIWVLKEFFVLQEEVDVLQCDGPVGQEHAATGNVLSVSGLTNTT